MSLVEVFRSKRERVCADRAFVLRAVGISSETIPVEIGYVLMVESDLATAAREHLARYAAENKIVELPPPAPILHDHAWAAPAVYMFSLVIVGYLAGQNSFRFDWYAEGSLPSAISDNREFWRAATALTLHADHQHLIGNLGLGAFFSYLAARLLGSGIAFACMVFSAVLGNLLNSALMPNNHVSIGASTMVFATLGLISAYSWRLRFSKRMQWAHRWAPLVVGIMLLGFMGAGNGEPNSDVDVLGHLAGFFCGVLAGVVLAQSPAERFVNATLQWLAGSAAIALLAGAWMWAGLHG